MNRMKVFLFMLACCWLFWLFPSPFSLNITVRDDDGHPVSGATVSGSFYRDRVFMGIKSPFHRGETDENGFVRLYGSDNLYVDVWARKDGYYDTTHQVLVRGGVPDQVQVLLRKKHNPIAMHARHANITLPEYNREFGYDLLKGDLVMPGRNGVNTDIILRVDRWTPRPEELGAELTIRFPHQMDGQVPMELKDVWGTSDFKTAYAAPEDGYAGILQASFKDRLGPGPGSRFGAEGHYEKININKPFFMRIRSGTDENGRMLANYCKVAPGVNIHRWGRTSPMPTVVMRHYCNPVPNDRNVEFDIRRNLIKRPKEDTYAVNEP
ncbi:hypothetical protein [Thioflexithrix psekupsensis]|uniref:Carboxypeptidase regulatory-like domain-containing protein n=1 Tax=Thioflexithrix psekupsensis TaxID=1570016 RepID=A0A251X3D8_9GAMM|nr:hypothetical protein [Thioflexithrix psekupsensis]OUD11682.1 hypothetical protein TPSD3_16645 [Thioflexithrix psekupsensis]